IVSKARLDFPDPERPVITISELRGSSRSTSLRLCSLAPRMTIRSDGAITSSVRGRTVVPGRPPAHRHALRHDERKRGIQVQPRVAADIGIESLDLVLTGGAGAAGITGRH